MKEKNMDKDILLDYDAGSHVIYDNNVYELDIVGFTIPSSHKINGKNCVMKGNDWQEKVSERKNAGHEMNQGLCFQYYNPVIKDYIASRIK